MRPSKNQRQTLILELISRRPIETQEELVDTLVADGFDVTQATISRDIKELGIIKVTTAEGRQRYLPMQHSGEAAAGRLMKVFVEAVTVIDEAGQLLVVKTLPGVAPAAAAALDSMHLNELVGTLAGDDTIFMATRSEEICHKLHEKLLRIIRTGKVGDMQNDVGES